VVELGFGEGSEEGALVVAGGEVEERPRDRRGWKTGIEDEVVGAQAALVQDEARGRLSVPRHRELDLSRRRRDDAPAPRGRAMAEDRAIARGHQSGNEESVLCGEFRRLRRIHALVDEVQPTRA
jgi:hypothetical protein